jgi:hypothetical protein
MTTDFRVTRVDDGVRSEEAIAVKQLERVGKRRTAEKLEIERLYWAGSAVSWRIVTEADLPTDYLHNLRFVQGMWSAEGLPFPPAEIPHIAAELEQFLRLRAATPLTMALQEFCEDRPRYSTASCLSVVRHALAAGLWSVDWTVRIDPLWTPIVFRPAAT